MALARTSLNKGASRSTKTGSPFDPVKYKRRTIKIGQRKEHLNQRLIVILPSFGERYLSTAMFESNTASKASQHGFL